MKPETKFRINRVEPGLKELQNSWFFSIQQQTIRDTPDKIGCINGLFVALEIKISDKAEIRKGQLLQGRMIRKKAKGLWFKVYPENWDEILTILRRIDNGKCTDSDKWLEKCNYINSR